MLTEFRTERHSAHALLGSAVAAGVSLASPFVHAQTASLLQDSVAIALPRPNGMVSAHAESHLGGLWTMLGTWSGVGDRVRRRCGCISAPRGRARFPRCRLGTGEGGIVHPKLALGVMNDCRSLVIQLLGASGPASAWGGGGVPCGRCLGARSHLGGAQVRHGGARAAALADRGCARVVRWHALAACGWSVNIVGLFWCIRCA